MYIFDTMEIRERGYMKRNILDRDQTCPDGMVFTEDESYLLCRYEEKDRKLYDKIWEETFGQSPVLNDTELKIKS